MAVHKIEPDDNIISQNLISSVEHLAVITVMGVTSTCIGVHVYVHFTGTGHVFEHAVTSLKFSLNCHIIFL